MTCQTPFTGASGAGCSSALDCQANLFCTNDTCTTPQPDGSDCSNDDASCPEDQFCECNFEVSGDTLSLVGPGTCRSVGTYTQSEINDFNSFQSCAKANGCFDYWSSQAISLVGGPNQCIAQCIQPNFDGGFGKAGLTLNKCDLGVQESTTTPPTTEESTTTPPHTSASTTAPTDSSAPPPQAEFTFKLTQCLTPGGPDLNALITAFANVANIDPSHITIQSLDSRCPTLNRKKDPDNFSYLCKISVRERGFMILSFFSHPIPFAVYECPG
jgi:hypothetical protein